MFIHPFSKCSAGFPNIVHVTLSAFDKVYDIADFTSGMFCKSFNWYDLWVKLHFTSLIVFIDSTVRHRRSKTS